MRCVGDADWSLTVGAVMSRSGSFGTVREGPFALPEYGSLLLRSANLCGGGDCLFSWAMALSGSVVLRPQPRPSFLTWCSRTCSPSSPRVGCCGA